MGGSGISCTICKSFAPRSRQITTPVAHHSLFTGRIPFLRPNQERQSTEGNSTEASIATNYLQQNAKNTVLTVTEKVYSVVLICD